MRVPDAPPASGGGRARHRPPATATSPRTPTGSYPPTTRKRQPRRGRAARQRRPATAGPRTETSAQEAESDRGGTTVRVFLTFVQQLLCTNFRSFRSNFRSIVFAQGTSAARPGEFPKLHVSPFFAWPSVAFDDPSTCCCIACVRFLCARRASPRAGQRSPVVCVCLSRQYFHRKTEERCVIVLRSNTDIWSWAGGSSKRQDESSERGLSLNRSQRGNCSTEYNTPLGT